MEVDPPFVPADSGSDDDETTIAAAEASHTARKRTRSRLDSAGNELSDLQHEATLPLPELLERHNGYRKDEVSALDLASPHTGTAAASAARAARFARRKASDGAATPTASTPATAGTASPSENWAMALSEDLNDAGADADFTIADEADDEATLEAEERGVSAAQRAAEEAAELAALQAEQDMPIEELMRMYGR